MKMLLILTALLVRPISGQSPHPPALPISQTISISKFGAKGDGASDDSKAFAATIAAASKAGAEVTLEDKTYVLKETLRIPNSIKPIAIIGGGHTTLLFAPERPLETGFLIDDASGVQLKSFVIRGSAGGLHYGININGSSNIRLENLVIENINGEGNSALSAIRLAGDDQIWITDSTISKVGLGPGKPAFAIWNYYNARSQHIYITHNHFLNNTANFVIALFDTDNSVVQDNLIDGGNNCVEPCINNGYGILFYRTSPPATTTNEAAPPWPYYPADETIIGNQITNTAGSGIYLVGVHGAKVIKNRITKTALRMDPVSLPTAGIALNGSNNVQIVDNIVIGSSQGGISLATTQDILIEGNQIHNSARWGIHLRVAQLRTSIKNNVIDGAPIGLLSERGAVSTIVENNVLTRVKLPTVGHMQ